MRGHIKKTNLIFINVFSLFFVRYGNATSESSLKLVHVVFRHGDRTTDSTTLYPKDPYINETYYPDGLGELTLEGKRREYQLGKLLRQRYVDFLGEIYTPDIVEAWSSNTNRAKASLELVLAGLFPPSKEQIFETGLNWQPIPFNMLPITEDQLFFGNQCPNLKKYFSEVVTSPKMLKELKLHSKEFRYIADNTGLEVKNYWDVFYLYTCLTTEKEHGFTLPKWTNEVYPQPLQDFAIKSYGLFTATTEMRRLTSGTLLKKIVDDSNTKIENNSSRKIFLYSGHEFNIAYLLITLDLFHRPHFPPYGCYVLFELHEINDVYGIKIYYQDYASPEPKLMKLPACAEFCPLDNFISLLEEYFPENNSCKSL